MAVTTDFRDVFAELSQHLGGSALSAVLPGYAFDGKKRLGLFR